MGKVIKNFGEAVKHTLMAAAETGEAVVRPSKSKFVAPISEKVIEYAPFIALGLTPHAFTELLHEQAKKGRKSKIKDLLVSFLHSDNIFGEGLGFKERPGFRSEKHGGASMSGKDRVDQYWKEAQLAEAIVKGVGAGLAGIGLSELYSAIKGRFGGASDKEAERIVTELMKEDPVLGSANKEMLISAYKTFAKLSPYLKNDKNLVKTFLHSAVATGGNIDIGTAKALLEANVNWRKVNIP
uniref:Uncharacterized protein n=1 Tax=candidate division CPR3 bacterium TaxID=2268181 RepID=A0A7C5UWD7_UNCC3